MAWSDILNNILDRYTGAGGGTAAAPENAHQDYQQVAQNAPQEVVAGGLSEAFRSHQTPAFPEMVANLFSHSDSNQRAGLLSRLSGVLGGNQVTPDQANNMSPTQVQEMAARAARTQPSVVDEVSSFYAQHPGVVKALGGLALSIAIQHMARKR